MRARIYLTIVEELDVVTEDDVSRCIAEHDEDVVIAAIRLTDIKDALLDGTIVSAS